MYLVSRRPIYLLNSPQQVLYLILVPRIIFAQHYCRNLQITINLQVDNLNFGTDLT